SRSRSRRSAGRCRSASCPCWPSSSASACSCSVRARSTMTGSMIPDRIPHLPVCKQDECGNAQHRGEGPGDRAAASGGVVERVPRPPHHVERTTHTAGEGTCFRHYSCPSPRDSRVRPDTLMACVPGPENRGPTRLPAYDERETNMCLAAAGVGPVRDGKRAVVRFGDLPAQGETDTAAAWLGSVERDEQIGGVGDAQAVVAHPDVQRGSVAAPTHGHATVSLERRIRAVADEIDQQLIELIAITGNRDGWPRLHAHRHAPLELRDAAYPWFDFHHSATRRGEAREQRVAGHEAAQRLGTSRDHCEAAHRILAPVIGQRRARDQTAQAARNGRDGGERVVDLVAEHANEALPGEALLVAQRLAQVGKHDELLRAPIEPEGATPELPSSGAARERRVDGAVRLAAQAAGQSERGGGAADDLALAGAEQLLAASVHEAQLAPLVEGENGDVDFLHYGAQQRGGLHGAQALRAQRLAQRVDFEQGEAERVIYAGASGAHGEVSFAERGEHVGNGLQRAHDALAQGQRDADPED